MFDRESSRATEDKIVGCYYKRVTDGLQIFYLRGRSHSSCRPTAAALTFPGSSVSYGSSGPSVSVC